MKLISNSCLFAHCVPMLKILLRSIKILPNILMFISTCFNWVAVVMIGHEHLGQVRLGEVDVNSCLFSQSGPMLKLLRGFITI